jgi:hypothetical protein
MQRDEIRQNAGASNVLSTTGVVLMIAGGALFFLSLFLLPMACSAVIGLDLIISGFLLLVGGASLLLGKVLKNRNRL